MNANVSAGHRLVAAIEQSAGTIAHDHRQQILDEVDALVDDWQDRAVTAITNNLPSGGVKTLEFGAIKSALLASEAQLDDATNVQFAKVFDAVTAALQKAGAS